jgi:TRAP-type mannitol/chloroaromatic compound transport system permease large subunit
VDHVNRDLLQDLRAVHDLRVTRTFITPGQWFWIWVAFALTVTIAWGLVVALLRCWRTGILSGSIYSTAQLTAMVFAILIGAALFTVVFRGLGGDETVRALLEGVPGGILGAMIVVMIAMFILGFFLDFIEITLVIVPIVAPILIVMGVDPLWLGIMMAINLQTSFLTPPFGFALFYLRGVAPAVVRTIDIYKGVIPFIAIQLFALVILWFFPELVLWLPGVLYGR